MALDYKAIGSHLLFLAQVAVVLQIFNFIFGIQFWEVLKMPWWSTFSLAYFMRVHNSSSLLVLFLVYGIASALIREGSTDSSAPFNPIEASIVDVHDALLTKNVTCKEIVSSYIGRIEKYNPSINAIITLNPLALSAASTIDSLLSNNSFPSPLPSLLCVPTLLKDNFDLAGVPTTGGSAAFSSMHPAQNAITVDALQSAGAIILGKANMHELALEGLTVSTSGGQTHNPYDLTRTPGGSSGGSGAALAANFAVLATGSDTMNSLRSPASANAIKSLRPTRGLLNKTGVLPLCQTQDVIGPMAKHASDLLAMYKVLLSATTNVSLSDLHAPLPEPVPGSPPLSGLTFGLVSGFVNYTDSPETTPVIDVVHNLTTQLTAAGATIVNITGDPFFDPARISALDVQRYEFQEDMDVYLRDPTLNTTGPRSFAELYGTNRSDYVVIPAQYTFVQDSFTFSRNTTAYASAISNLTNLSSTLLQKWSREPLSSVDFLIFPQERNLVKKIGADSQSGRNGHLGALTGFPVLAFPAGYGGVSESAPRGVPVGFEFLGKRMDDLRLLDLGRRLEGVLGDRVRPELTEGPVGVKVYEEVPSIVPNATVPREYPVGRYRE